MSCNVIVDTAGNSVEQILIDISPFKTFTPRQLKPLLTLQVRVLLVAITREQCNQSRKW